MEDRSNRIETTGTPNKMAAFSAAQRRHEIRITRLRNIRRVATTTGQEALIHLLDLLIEEELAA